MISVELFLQLLCSLYISIALYFYLLFHFNASMILVDLLPCFALGGDYPHQRFADPPTFLCLETIYLLAGPGRNKSQAGPSNYKGKEKAQ